MRGFRLGRLLGFPISIDFSWFIIFFLVLWTFTAAVFPGRVPDADTEVHLVMGLTATLLFFASLVAHELAHSVVARAKGIPVEGITLFVFGGVSQTRAEAEEPEDEFLMAGAGPLVSVALGAVFGLAWLLGRMAGWDPAITTVAEYLAYLNLVLAAFNLLPGFPLDGGRLFRALVWRATGDLEKATRVSTTSGRAIGVLLAGLGLWQLFVGGTLGGLWAVFIGWFLYQAAGFSYRQHRVRNILEGATAREAMTLHPETVSPELTLEELVDHFFLRRRHDAYPVTRDGGLVGFITLDRVKELPRDGWASTTVERAMLEADQIGTVHPDDALSLVVERLRDEGTGHLLVSRHGDLEGIITPADIASWLATAQRRVGSRRSLSGTRADGS